ncbi:type II secretion system F family protein [Streptomyces sp. MAG02]|nr:type II secretion system F family protein [Streptomyces sp. MAG02]
MTWFWLILAEGVLIVGLVLLAMRDFLWTAGQRHRAVSGGAPPAVLRPGTVVGGLNSRFVRTRPGRWLARELELGGITWPPARVAAATILVSLLVAVVFYRFLAPAFAVLGVVLGMAGLWEFVRRAQQRRTVRFVSQLPELARLLANASHAGLSLPTAIAMVSEELGEPARSEFAQVESRLKFGASLQSALDELTSHVKSREVSVLMSTLVVSSRSGGSLVTALRNIADSLEERKETRREVTTILSQSLATAYLIIVIGLGLLIALNFFNPGTVELMTHSHIGRICLVVGLSLFAVGFVVIRQMTKVKL